MRHCAREARTRLARSTSTSLGANGWSSAPLIRSCRAKSRHPVERSREAPAAAPAIVLVRPQLGENIGKAARAMLNFGLTDLRLVAPRDGWPNPSAGPAASGRRCGAGAGAGVRHASPRRSPTAPIVYATTVRKRGLVVPVVTPEEAAREIQRQPAAVGHPVRRRAVGARDRRGRDRRQDPHRAGQSRTSAR